MGFAAQQAPAQSCSIDWDRHEVPAWGTATHAEVVIALEQNGPWGKDAVTESHLDPELGTRLDAHVRHLGGRLLLIRRSGRHAEQVDGARQCLVARTGPAGWLVTAELSDPAVLLSLTAAALAGAEPTAAMLSGSVASTPELLVCTNGRRDACCAVRGRPLALAAAASHPGRVWEVTHTGGHRFAPTAILLPWGRILARLDPLLADRVLVAASHGHLAAEALGPRHDRGAMHMTPREQAIEAFLRQEWGLTDLTTAPSIDPAAVTVNVVHGPALPVSCGRAPEPTTWFVPTWATEDRSSPPTVTSEAP